VTTPAMCLQSCFLSSSKQETDRFQLNGDISLPDSSCAGKDTVILTVTETLSVLEPTDFTPGQRSFSS
jgi:hypothetical protein